MQVGSLIIFLEYDRSRRKEVQKQQKEAAERQGIIERAREEREVRRCMLLGRSQQTTAATTTVRSLCVAWWHLRATDTLLCCVPYCVCSGC
jgi:hypothetical protein